MQFKTKKTKDIYIGLEKNQHFLYKKNYNRIIFVFCFKRTFKTGKAYEKVYLERHFLSKSTLNVFCA